jgi:hypothetical protein
MELHLVVVLNPGENNSYPRGRSNGLHSRAGSCKYQYYSNAQKPLWRYKSEIFRGTITGT